MTPSLLMAGWRLNDIGGYNKTVKIAKAVVGEYTHNRKFYHDIVKFNFFNGVKSKKTYPQVCFEDPPPEVKKQLFRLYNGRYNGFSNEYIYVRLGLKQTRFNKHSPLESKWAFSYYKKYGHWDYYRENVVTDNEILRPLNTQELDEYISLLG